MTTYRIATPMTYPVDAETTQALVDARELPDDEREAVTRNMVASGKMRSVAIGECVDDLPEASVAWLLDQGHIVIEGE